MTQCPCGSGRTYRTCCEPFINGTAWPQTASELMRARYTAYTMGNVDYIGTTYAPTSGAAAHAKAAQDWVATSKFKSLKIVRTSKGGAEDNIGKVEFLATYEQAGQAWDHHEVSEFARDSQGHWRFISSESHRHAAGEDHHHGHHHDHGGHTLRRATPKVGRNDPCPCGSGKKYKKCCGASD